LPCSALVKELQDALGLDILTTNDADLPIRHQSIVRNLQDALAELGSDELAIGEALSMVRRDWGRQDRARGRGLPRELLPRLKWLDEHGMLRIDSATGTVKPHPLVRLYAQSWDDSKSASAIRAA
jgi:hypothetical protein